MPEDELVVDEEQRTENTVDGDSAQADPQGNEPDNEIEENEIVLAGQDEVENKGKSDPKSHILKRVMKRESKLQNENEQLKAQLNQLANNQGAPVVAPEPDEFAFNTREEYLQAKAEWQQNLMHTTVSQQLQTQQHGHKAAAKEQERENALNTYATNAAGLNVSDFNETQDKAFDVLGDEFAQMIAQALPEDAPKLMYWLGKNPKDAAAYRDNYMSNPGGTTFALGKLAGKLTIKPKRSEAADPETKVEGAGEGGLQTDWQAKLDKIDNDADMSNISKALKQRRKLKKEAAAAGVDVSTLR
jgi:hypothetical protein